MNTKFLSASVMMGLLLASCNSTKNAKNDLAVSTPIETSINLDNVTDDKAPVVINPGRFTVSSVTYRLPRVVQGTYSVSDFGKYVDDFKAINYKGESMPVVNVDENTWTIANAKELDKITYLVNDTFDIETKGGIGGEEPFSPSGTNIEPENYVLNLHGFIGYFDTLKNNQYKLDVTGSADFVRTSALQTVNSKTSEDGKSVTTSYFATRYFDITDNPMMYGKLDVEEFMVGDIKIVLSVYSPNNVHSAASLKDVVFKMMQAQKVFLGDINSTPRYDIYLYLSEGTEESPKGFGALEHHTSTVVVLPEDMDEATLASSMTDVVSHEFFHIVTPLSVHSEDVHYFDYNNPTFSKHLWMYEGVTEYFATLFQVSEDLVSEDEFFNKIMEKVQESQNMNDAMSFTIMSENVLKAPYKDQYTNVYQKGALIGMCIDIMLREESNGQRGILSLMKELSNKYGKNKPFEDDKLIDEIVAMTYPSLRDFFDNHVIGDIPINYNQFLGKVGLEITEGKVETGYVHNAGTLLFGANPEKGEVFFTEEVSKNSFWNEQGVQPNDVLKAVSGEPFTMQNANDLLQKMFAWTPGTDINVTLNREGKDIEINTKTTKSYTMGNGVFEKKDVTEAQKTLREAWLKG
ncbi:M61 family metallopeptidase [Algibacter lectus]|uniref:Putative metalloprotease with PDZ domain n=1 Tax=Algibacter lectus TaxID=221126 RepID=A0A4R8MKF3_9FLAO|nr:peptidase M61 [Algibacter lectus]MWW25151.1 peptidase M61 [Algibacter lectus]TDY64435.1 putative metalloprotease with PDZ domain [Algibacter lectus]